MNVRTFIQDFYSLTAGAAAASILAGVSVPVQAAAPKDLSYRLEVVAQVGPAPGGGEHEGDFEPHDINARGDVFFGSDLNIGGEGLYVRSGNMSRLIARVGDPIPGSGGALHYGGGFYTPNGMNDAGSLVYTFSVWEMNGQHALFRYSAAQGLVTPLILPEQTLPGGTKFWSALPATDINNRGDMVATLGIYSSQGACQAGYWCANYGEAVYKVDKANRFIKIAAPGDVAPGSADVFDDLRNPSLNDAGDVVFGGHVRGKPGCNGDELSCLESLYRYRASTGAIESLVQIGEPAPAGAGIPGLFTAAWGGRINNRGDISFTGWFDSGAEAILLRQRDGRVMKIAATGDLLAPGYIMSESSDRIGGQDINQSGMVAFNAQTTATDQSTASGVYVWSAGTISKVVQTGDELPGIGRVLDVANAFSNGILGGNWMSAVVRINERGQVMTQVTVETPDLRRLPYVVMATPVK